MSDTVTDQEVEDFFEHFGIPGMRWGHRKARDNSQPRVTRKQNRQMNREAEQKFNSNKASTIYQQAKKHGDRVLIETITPGDFAKTVVTGREFAHHLERGGAFDIRTTEIFARQRSEGAQFELNENRIGSYRKQNFRN